MGHGEGQTEGSMVVAGARSALVKEEPSDGLSRFPLKITAYLQYQPSSRWSLRSPFNWFGAGDYRLADGETQLARADVKSSYKVDVLGRYQFDNKNPVGIGVQKLFNRYQLPLYSQLMRSGKNDSRLPAAGATLMASYTHNW